MTRAATGSNIYDSMGIHVRHACPEDAESIVGILNPIIEAGVHTAFDTPFTVEHERRFIESLSPRSIFHVAVRQPAQTIVGFQIVDPRASYTHAFDHVGTIGTYVDLAARRRGIAKALFAATFEEAVRKGYEKFFTFVRADNPAALATYHHHGFQIVGTARRQSKVNGRYIDEIMIERFLSETA